MKITLAETAGFCFGVNRAVNMVYELLENGEKVCTLGPIIHNPQLVEELKEKGVRIVDTPDEVKDGEILVIRSHGVELDVINKAEELGVRVSDATCPFVAKIHKIVSEESLNGAVTIIAGDSLHQEVKGIIGHCHGECYVVSGVEELEELLKIKGNFDQKSLILVSQTTFNAEIWENTQKILKKVCTNAKIFDTICNATSMRQSEADLLSKINDMIIVVGGKHSSNTAKLYDVCKANCRRTYHLETASEISDIDFNGVGSVGVVAGASTPAGIIKEVIKTMSEILQPVEEQMEVKESVQKSFEEMTDE